MKKINRQGIIGKRNINNGNKFSEEESGDSITSDFEMWRQGNIGSTLPIARRTRSSRNLSKIVKMQKLVSKSFTKLSDIPISSIINKTKPITWVHPIHNGIVRVKDEVMSHSSNKGESETNSLWEYQISQKDNNENLKKNISVMREHNITDSAESQDLKMNENSSEDPSISDVELERFLNKIGSNINIKSEDVSENKLEKQQQK